MAEAYGKAGQAEKGLPVLAEALAQVDKTGERFYEAELYRLKGELTLQSNVQSLEAKVQGKLRSVFSRPSRLRVSSKRNRWELRAVTSLARLWQQQGKKTEAHKLLSEVYNWFTEGFDTKDLQEAKTLLEELSH